MAAMNALTAKVTASLVALFGLGMATGYVIGHRPAGVATVAVAGTNATVTLPADSRAARTASKWCERRLEELQQTLDLSPEQRTAIEARFEELTEEYHGLRMETQVKVGEAIARMNKRIAKELTPEQRARFWEDIRRRSQSSSG
jgi:Spy/CpxP family protein refolding chaperone